MLKVMPFRRFLSHRKLHELSFCTASVIEKATVGERRGQEVPAFLLLFSSEGSVLENITDSMPVRGGVFER